MYDGLVISNKTDHRLIITPYRQDGLAMKSYGPSVGKDELRLINNDHFGDADFYIIAAFMDGAEIPPKFNAQSEASSASMSIGGGFSVLGTGGSFSFGAGGGGTTFFSNYLAATIIPVRKKIRNDEFGDHELGTNDEWEIREIPIHILLAERADLVIVDKDGKKQERSEVPAETKLWDFKRKGERPLNDERATFGW